MTVSPFFFHFRRQESKLRMAKDIFKLLILRKVGQGRFFEDGKRSVAGQLRQVDLG